jgi:hypothetical protein
MPNWVFNSIVVEGTKADVTAFLDYAKKPTPFCANDDHEREFNFHSFITPPADKVEEYLGRSGFIDGKIVGDGEFNWYQWNNANWDTKWNACDVNIDRFDTSAVIRFDTAWSAPMPIFKAIAEQFPKLDFDIEYEEEQGWGGTMRFLTGELTFESEWDCPNSHSDYTERGRDCICSYDDDVEDWYDDCPREEKSMIDNTITVTGTDVNVGEAVDAVINGEADLSVTYEYKSADMYGVGDDPRKVGANVDVQTLVPITNEDLDGFRIQFPAIEAEVAKND